MNKEIKYTIEIIIYSGELQIEKVIKDLEEKMDNFRGQKLKISKEIEYK